MNEGRKESKGKRAKKGDKGEKGDKGDPGPPISDCRTVIFPSSQEQIPNGDSLVKDCPTGYYAISVTCGSWPDYLLASFPTAQKGGCLCNNPLIGGLCQVAANIIVLRCCK